MIQFITFLIIGAVGIIVGYYFAVNRKTKEARGIVARQAKEKKENLRKIREYMRGRESIANDEVEKLLEVSDATATNYLQELEDTGEIRQVGASGRSVRYKPNG